jgi:hypothetical protein
MDHLIVPHHVLALVSVTSHLPSHLSVRKGSTEIMYELFQKFFVLKYDIIFNITLKTSEILDMMLLRHEDPQTGL